MISLRCWNILGLFSNTNQKNGICISVNIWNYSINSDENKAKNKYAIEHFAELNEQLEEKGIKQKYIFNFLSPTNYSDYFTYLRDERLLDGKYKSELDILLTV